MSDPVGTDALRDAAWEKYAAVNHIHPHSIERDTFEQGWDAAADEVDRLRAELAISENRAGGYEEVVAGLRTVIENAPHREHCRPHIACTCWKADAL